jgi:hypothetical protein
LDCLINSTRSLAHGTTTLSQRFSCLPRDIRSRSSAAAIEHAERKHSKGHIDKSFLQVVARAERCLKGIAKLVLRSFRDVIKCLGRLCRPKDVDHLLQAKQRHGPGVTRH